MNIERNSDRILLRYEDSKGNFYKCTISEFDSFVINFCRRDLSKMEKILANHILIEMSDHFILRIEEPIYLEYTLKRELYDKMDIITNNLHKFEKIKSSLEKSIAEKDSKINEMETKMEKMTKLFETRISDLERKISNFLFVPGYDGAIDKNCPELILHGEPSDQQPIIFTGQSLAPFANMKALISVSLKKINIVDLYPLKSCLLITYITIVDCPITNIDFVETLKKLEAITINDCQSINDLRPLEKCPNVEYMDFSGCQNILYLPSNYVENKE